MGSFRDLNHHGIRQTNTHSPVHCATRCGLAEMAEMVEMTCGRADIVSASGVEGTQSQKKESAVRLVSFPRKTASSPTTHQRNGCGRGATWCIIRSARVTFGGYHSHHIHALLSPPEKRNHCQCVVFNITKLFQLRHRERRKQVRMSQHRHHHTKRFRCPFQANGLEEVHLSPLGPASV